MSDDPTFNLIHSLGDTLDGLDVALCAFDENDCTLAWNRTFFKFFPEHEGHVYVGEPYHANLRRFYTERLDAQELPNIDRYIAAGVERHRAQTRPYSFEHRGLRVHVSSLPIAGVGRVRVWRAEAVQSPQEQEKLDKVGDANIHEPGYPRSPMVESTELFDRIPDGLMICGEDQRIQWVNEPFMQMYSLVDRAAATGLSFEDIYRGAWAADGPGDMAPFYEGLTILHEHMRFAGAPFEVPLPRNRWSRVIAKQGLDGTVFYAHVDITEFKRQQRRLAQAERSARDSEAQLREKSILLEATLENMDQGVAKISATGIVELCNRRALELLDLPVELMASKPSLVNVLAYLRARGEFDGASQEIQDMLLNSDGGVDQQQVYDRPRPDGRILEVQTVPIKGGGALRTFTDVTQRKQAEHRIRHVAEHDGLTGLLNRSAFLQTLQAAVPDARRQGQGFAVLYVDLDGFKPINDRFGHAVGDQLLAWVARQLAQAARENDVVARLGGDEFALLQRGVSDRDSALRLGERLVQAIAQPTEIESHFIQIGASVGIVMSSADATNAEELLRKADSAMYLAKASGRGCVRIYGA
ncbi:MAG: diguanylate cyclase [Burkholderiales bacterium RIFCSPHIGHO2_01_FULL_64_960]|nr:MAG: diguanylate cyclase [Burkholderiales bacterium RIFCSPHIGHO2_01_FULL_64_960]